MSRKKLGPIKNPWYLHLTPVEAVRTIESLEMTIKDLRHSIEQGGNKESLSKELQETILYRDNLIGLYY